MTVTTTTTDLCRGLSQSRLRLREVVASTRFVARRIIVMLKRKMMTADSARRGGERRASVDKHAATV
jgi:hypothetical protein